MEIQRNHLIAIVALLVIVVGYLVSTGKVHPNTGRAPSAQVEDCKRTSARAAILAAYIDDTTKDERIRAFGEGLRATIPGKGGTLTDVEQVRNARTGRFMFRLTAEAAQLQAQGCQAAF